MVLVHGSSSDGQKNPHQGHVFNLKTSDFSHNRRLSLRCKICGIFFPSSSFFHYSGPCRSLIRCLENGYNKEHIEHTKSNVYNCVQLEPTVDIPKVQRGMLSLSLKKSLIETNLCLFFLWNFKNIVLLAAKKKLKVYIFIRFNIYSQLTKRAFLWYQVHRLMTIFRQQIILWINLLNAYCISLFLYFLIFQNKFFEMLYYFFWNIIHWVENIRHWHKRLKTLTG